MMLLKIHALSIVFYILLYFSMSSFFYYLSIHTGYNGLSFPLFGGEDDGVFYYNQALNVAANEEAILTSIHAVVLGWVLKFFNTDQVFLLRAFNLLGSVLTLFVGLKIVSLLQLGKRNIVAYTIFAILLAYYPSLLMNSNLSILRDPWIIFYYLLSILFLFNSLRANNLAVKLCNLVLLFLSLWMLYGYRDYALLCFLSSTLIYFLFIYQKKENQQNKSVFVYVIIGFSILYTFFKSFKFPIVELSLQNILLYRTSGLELAVRGSQMNISLDQSNILKFYVNYFYSVISNAFGPFPWQFTGVSSMILFFAESLLFLFIVYTLIKLRKKLNRYDLFIIVNSIIWFMFIGIFNDNFGTAARLRLVGWVLLFIVFAKVYGAQLMLIKIKKLQEDGDS